MHSTRAAACYEAALRISDEATLSSILHADAHAIGERLRKRQAQATKKVIGACDAFRSDPANGALM